MCGIFALLNNNFPSSGTLHNTSKIKENFYKGSKRGPENTTFNNEYTSDNLLLGFHRLAINGLDDISNQPITVDNITIICNGEIYNYKQLYEIMGIKSPKTNSDCEVIIHMYKRYGIKQTLIMLDGVFSFVLYDKTSKANDKIIVARDPYGVRPLYMCCSFTQFWKSYFFASEMKTFNEVVNKDDVIKHVLTNKNGEITNSEHLNTTINSKITQFKPGHFMEFNLFDIDKLDYNQWIPTEYMIEEPLKRKPFVNIPYFTPYVSQPCINYSFGMNWGQSNYNGVYNLIYESLSNAVCKRVVGTTERPIACLLSGGLDSSLICALVNRFYGKSFETYSIGMPGGEDTKYAKLVADHIGSIHTVIELSEDDFFNAIPEVIYNIESYDTTTVRASVGNYLVAKYIKENSNAKVIFNGDGSDELTGGYLYFHAAPDEVEFDKECRRLLKDIHCFDVLRSDKSISSNGLEPRTPFLDRGFIQTYLSIAPGQRFHVKGKQCEKWLLRKSFDRDDLLPSEVLWRTKEAFSDGVSSKKRSWYQIIEDKIPKEIKEKFDAYTNSNINATYTGVDLKTKYPHNTPTTYEQFYYRTLFEEYYGNKGMEKTIPYFWLPKWVDAKDSSARTLDIYNERYQESPNVEPNVGPNVEPNVEPNVTLIE